MCAVGELVFLAIRLEHVVVARSVSNDLDLTDLVQCRHERWFDVYLHDVHGFGATARGVLHEQAMGHFLGGGEFFQHADHVYRSNQRPIAHARYRDLAGFGGQFFMHHGVGDHASDFGVCV